MTSASDDFLAACSDEEIYAETGCQPGQLKYQWRPKPADRIRLFQQIEQNHGVLSLPWQCPGRRPPTPVLQDDEEFESDDDDGSGARASAAARGTPGAAAGAATPSKANDFDFDDDAFSSPSAATTPRRPLHGGASRELKGSARKKTTSFNNILSNMKRHRQMDAANRAAAAAASGASPATHK